MGLDRARDPHQQLPGYVAGGAAQVVQDRRGGELHDAGKVLVLQVVGRVQSAAGEEGKLNAGSKQTAEAHLQIQLIQLLQKAVLHVVGKVCEMIPVGFPHHAAGGLHQLFAQVALLDGTALLLQRRQHRALVFLPQLPQVRFPCPPHRAGVRVVVQVFQIRAAIVRSDHRNGGGPGLAPAVHGVVPQLHIRAGYRVRALRVDQQLVVIGIFIKTGGSGQVFFPAFHILRHRSGGLVRQLRHIP